MAMDKAKVKSILPKPSPSILPSIPSPPIKHDSRERSISVSSLGKNSNLGSRNNQNNQNSHSHTTNNKISKYEKPKPTGHRPVTSCTFCRQHKIKCNALDNFPSPCARCDRMGLKCEIDPEFRPKKGSQIQSLKSDVDELKAKIEMLTKNENLLTQALTQQNLTNLNLNIASTTTSTAMNSYNNNQLDDITYSPSDYSESPKLDNNNNNMNNNNSTNNLKLNNPLNKDDNLDNSPQTITNQPNNLPVIDEFILGEVHLPLSKANELHDRFINNFLPYLPILKSNNATELYYKSQLLFWSIILTASLSEPEPSLYMSLSSLIKQLAIETCWIRTPRSTHVIQSLIILSIWPLPNEKVLDDTSYRFIGLAKNLSLQLGLHRGGEFIKEFSRTQVNLGPDSEKWRTRSWLSVFFCEQFWSSTLGLPPSINTTDYLLENARIDSNLPKNFRNLISLSIFQCKLVNVMGISVTRPDGLLEPSNRAGSLNILDRELERLKFKLKIEDGSSIEIYFLYIKLMICGFAFLPGTPIEDQVKYVSSGYLSATRIITIISQMINNNKTTLIELPIYIRQSLTYSVCLLFKLHLSRYLIDKYVDSSRQSIVTVHRLLRNTLSSWKDLQNDISRTAKLLENLNIALYNYPDIFVTDEDGSIISNIRSHLTASLFYDLVWCVHEARRRNTNGQPMTDKKKEDLSRLLPLPFYNQITKDDFKTIITTSPNGTTVTTLVPTDQAMLNAKKNNNKEINGIPLLMLEATGSFKDGKSPKPEHAQLLNSNLNTNSNSNSIMANNSIVASAPTPAPSHATATPAMNNPHLSHHHRGSMSIPGASPATMMQQAPTMVDLQSSPNFFDDQMLLNPNIIIDNTTGVPNDTNNVQAPFLNDQMDNFFQQQSNGWVNDNQDDDFLGWFDSNSLE